jgi:hypothetical protein
MKLIQELLSPSQI